jgi:uncharacterized protein
MNKIVLLIFFHFFCLISISFSQELVVAVKTHDAEKVKALISSGADVNAKGDSNVTPIIAAVRSGDSLITGILLEHGANANETIRERVDKDMETEKTALMLAAERGFINIAMLLLDKHADINKQASLIYSATYRDYHGKGESALMMAVRSGSLKTMKLLLERKADVDARAEMALSNYSFDFLKGKVTDAGPELVKERPRFVENSTALDAAIDIGDTTVIRMLLEAGADANFNDGQLLIKPAEEGNTKLVELLANHGANVNTGKNTLSSPLIVACRKGDKKTADILLDKQADINQKAGDIQSPAISWAVLSGNIELVSDLLDRGADIDATTNNNSSPLLIAAGNGNTNTVKLLIERKAKIGKANDNGQTAIMMASKKGHPDCVQILISAGADINTEDKKGITALAYAKQGGFQTIVEMLIKAGAKE